MSMNNISSKKTKVGGLDVHYFTAGQGDPLVVLHGGGGDARTWMNNIAALSDYYTVYAPDLPGYGGSQPLDGNYYIPELAEFVDSFSDNLELENFHLVGHSLGGGIALNYALKSPHRIRKLVLVSSLCLGREIALWVRLLSIPAICRSIGSAVLAVLKSIKWLIKALLVPVEFVMPFSPASVNLGGSVTTFKEQTLVLANRLSEIVMPTLVVWGAKDPIVPVRHAYAAAQLIPDCQLKVFKDRGHNVYRDDIGEFSRLLTGFLG
jgi:pyruvate dehydrogenase E2 component (dihydrolipoamide acetyltransferase)